MIANHWNPAPAILSLALLLPACGESDAPQDSSNGTNFILQIENLTSVYSSSGAFDTPEGAIASSAAAPGQQYTFSFKGEPGDRLSVAFMFVQSNDLFFAPAAAGMPLHDASAQPIIGDVTGQFTLWDAGTETNEMPGSGPNQAPRQSAANTGFDENGIVQPVSQVTDGFVHPAVEEVLKATLSHSADTFSMRLAVNASSNTAIAPGVYVVHKSGEPLFSAGLVDRREGLEALAEDGNAGSLKSTLAARLTAFGTALAQGVWAVHSGGTPLFNNNSPAPENSLEALAEDGLLEGLLTSLGNNPSLSSYGSFNIPDGASVPAGAKQGDTYSFRFRAKSDQRLSFATMMAESNDLFFAPPDTGARLFDAGGQPNLGDLTGQIDLWDAGTELNELPGAGPNQATRQADHNTGPSENSVVQPVSNTGDGFTYPEVGATVRVTLSLR